MKKILIIGLVGLLSASANAQSMDSMLLATNLGSVIASEEFCGLTYNQDAIAAFIEENVAADDMGFTTTLNMMVEGGKYNNNSMSASAKTAHCAQTERVAVSYSFVD